MSIDAKDLMIGNWVKFINKILQVSGGTIEDCERANKANSPYQYEPIPLTPEILTDWCGLNRDKEGWYLSADNKLYDPLERGGTGEYFQRDATIFAFKHVSCILNKGIKYLHQLQNLYKALTGQELTVNIPKL